MMYLNMRAAEKQSKLFMEYLKLGLYKRRLNWYNSFVDKMYMRL